MLNTDFVLCQGNVLFVFSIILFCADFKRSIFCLCYFQVELTFRSGATLYVFGNMDEDGFFYGEHNGKRGLVPSNFLKEAPPPGYKPEPARHRDDHRHRDERHKEEHHRREDHTPDDRRRRRSTSPNPRPSHQHGASPHRTPHQQQQQSPHRQPHPTQSSHTAKDVTPQTSKVTSDQVRRTERPKGATASGRQKRS